MTKYFKLGAKASTFYDPTSGLKISNGAVAQFSGSVITKRMEIAISNHHIEEATEAEFKNGTASAEEEDEAVNFDKMNKSQLVEYLQTNYEVDEAEVEDFENKTKSEMVSYLEEL